MLKKLILSPSSFLKAKFKDLRSKVKHIPREARDSFLAGMESQLKCNPKRFWSTFKLKSKHRGISEVITMATGPSGDPADSGNRTQASSPAEIVDLFNRYFVLVFTSDSVTCKLVDEEDAGHNVDLTLSDLTLTVTQVLDGLANLDASKATGPDEIPAIILKETAQKTIQQVSRTRLRSRGLESHRCGSCIQEGERRTRRELQANLVSVPGFQYFGTLRVQFNQRPRVQSDQ